MYERKNKPENCVWVQNPLAYNEQTIRSTSPVKEALQSSSQGDCNAIKKCTKYKNFHHKGPL